MAQVSTGSGFSGRKRCTNSPWKQLGTAEGVTRYLRSKDSSLDEILKVSNELIDEQLDVYLPNKRVFVFELVRDRLNDNKQLKYKTSPAFWELFNKVYTLLDDKKLKSRTLQAFKFGEVVSTALEKSDPAVQSELLAVLIRSINLFRLNFSLSASRDHAIVILSSILQILNKSNYEPEDRSQFIIDTTAFFNASINGASYNGKFFSSFISSALPPILDTIRTTPESNTLTSLVKKTILHKDQFDKLQDNTKQLLETDISEESIVTFYKLVIDTIPRSETQTFEQLFILITAKFPQSSERLLEHIVSTKRTLSPEFPILAFEQEFSKPLQNWNLICSVLQLDIEVGIQNAEKILINLSEQSFQDYMPIVDVLISSFNRARNLFDFLQLWHKLLQDGYGIYASPKLSKAVSQRINTLSFTQLKTLVEDFLSKHSKSKYIVLSAIVEGFFSLKDRLLFDQSEELFKVLFNSRDDTSALWKLKYQLLTLYETIVPKDHLLKIANGKYKKFSEFQFYTLFRIREIVEFDLSKFTKSFIDFITENEHLETLKYSFNRWFVLINESFTTEQINTLVSELLKDKDLLVQVLRNDDFFEQTKIVESIIDQISNSKEFTSVYNQVLQTIPIQCYPKRFKLNLINSLTKQVKSSTDEELVKTIVHILSTPTFKSEIETEIENTISVIRLFPDSSIFEVVWDHHLKNLKESISQKYIGNCIKEVTKALGSSKIEKITPEFYIAFTILTNQPSTAFTEELLELQKTFISASKSLLSSSFSTSDDPQGTSWLLKVLRNLDLEAEDYTTLHEPLKQFGIEIQNSDDTEAKASLFTLLAKYSKFTETFVDYYEALYLVLRQSSVSQDRLSNGLGYVLKNLEEDQFNSEYAKALKSLIGPNVDYITEIIISYWRNSQRSNQLAVRFFINSLSKISNNISTLTNSESIILVLTELKSILVDQSWLISQYSLELIIALLTQLADALVTSPLSSKEEIFHQITLVTSNILLFHRFRLSNRHHIVLSLFNSLLGCLSTKATESILSLSKSSAEALSRLLSNLCEPQVRDTKSKDKDSLTSATATLKRSLRKYLGVTLLTYIHLSLKFPFHSEIREALLPGIFNIFDVLSQQELVLVSTSLDLPGRSYYRTLYDEYKKVGKWQVD